MMAVKPVAIVLLAALFAAPCWATDGRSQPLSAARAAADEVLQLAAQRAQQLRQAPLDRAFVTLMLPYGPETVPEGKTTADARLALETKRFYWQGVRRTLDAEYSRRRKALLRRLTKKARRLNAPIRVADESLGRERSAVRLVIEDIDFDLSNLGAAGPKDGAKLLERKAELFRTLALLKN